MEKEKQIEFPCLPPKEKVINPKKKKWEDGFQKWSNEHGQDGRDDLGICGYGSMCDFCTDNSYGRPCVRALNSMLRESGNTLNYEENYEDIWYGNGKDD